MRTLLLALVAVSIAFVSIVAEPAIAPATIDVCAQAGAGANVNGQTVGHDTGEQCVAFGV